MLEKYARVNMKRNQDYNIFELINMLLLEILANSGPPIGFQHSIFSGLRTKNSS
jgi:hypothetical protein